MDALYLSGRASLPGGLLERLRVGREVAENEERSVPFELGGEEFAIAPHANGKYRFCLKHQNGQIGLTPSTRLPALRIQPRAEFLHGVGPRDTCTWFSDVIEQEVGPLRLSVNRLDLFMDVQGWAISGDDRSKFLCRADALVTHESGEKFNGLRFGERNSGTMTARIYNKSVESKKKGTDYWPMIWGDLFDPAQPVIRVEFEFLRAVLREYGLDSPADVLDATGGLWAAATDWLSYRTPTDDLTHSRWPIAPEWQRIQHASIREDAAGLKRVRAGKMAGSLRQMMPQLNGYVVSFAALLDADDLRFASELLWWHLRDYERETGISFSSRVATRQREQSIT